MKKAGKRPTGKLARLDDDLRPEYEEAQLRSGVRGKYAERMKQGGNLVLLEPDVAAAFPDEKRVNQALPVLIEAARSTVARSAKQPV